MGRGQTLWSYQRYDIGCARGRRRRATRVPHGGAGRGGRHHRTHPALLPGAQTDPAAPPRGPYRLVRRHPPGPAAHDLGAAGTRPHAQRHSRAGGGLRPGPRRGRTAGPRGPHRGGPGPPLPRGTRRPLRRPGDPGEPRRRPRPRLPRHRRRRDRPHQPPSPRRLGRPGPRRRSPRRRPRRRPPRTRTRRGPRHPLHRPRPHAAGPHPEDLHRLRPWRRAWRRRNCHWRWTGGCGRPERAIRGRSRDRPRGRPRCVRGRRPPSPAHGPTTARRVSRPAPRTP